MKKVLIFLISLFVLPIFVNATILNDEYYVNDEVSIDEECSISDNKIATISNNKIKFIYPGEVTINNKKINVYNKIERIEIVEGDKLEVSLYKDYLLNVKVYPDNTKKTKFIWSKEEDNNIDIKTWFEGNEYISNMDDTKRAIRLFEEGTYKLTVSTEDNKFSDTIEIKGVKKINDISFYPPVTNTNEEKGSIIMYLSENETLKLPYYIYPEDVKDNSVIFASVDNNIATVDSKGVITAKSVGKTKIVAKSNDGNARNEIEIEVKEKQSQIKSAPKYIIDTFDNTVAILWDHINGTSNYIIYRSVNSENDFKKIATTKEIFYYDEKLNYGDTYYYKIEAKNSLGSKTSSVTSIKILPDSINTLEFSKVKSTSVKLLWSKVSATGYRIYRSTNKNGGFVKIKTITSNKTTSYTDSGLKSNTTYYYKIKSYKLVNDKKIFSKEKIFSIKTSPKKPKVSISINEYDSLKINVKSVGGATKYLIYRSDSKDGTYKKIKELKKSGTYTDSGLQTNLKYYYKVKACNKDNNCSDYSQIVSEKVKLKTPSIKLTKKNKTVKVTISSVKAADGYKVYRSKSKKGKYKLVDTISKNKLSEVVKKGKYYYKVRAYIIIDGKKVYSKYSSIKNIKIK